MADKTVLVLSPMDGERDLLVSRLADRREENDGGYVFSAGTFARLRVVAARCLVGTVNAAACTALATRRYRPACVILQGTAGAHDPDLKKGDLVIAEKIISLGNVKTPYRTAGEGSDPESWEPFGVQVYDRREGKTAFTNTFVCDPALTALARTVPYAGGRIFSGTAGSADRWNREADLILHYHSTLGTLCEEMEGAGAAQVCQAFGVPFCEIRVISNNELTENRHYEISTAKSCQEFTLDFLKALSESGLLI